VNRTLHVWVAEGRIVRDPVSRARLQSDAAGIEVPRTTFFLRRIADGDLLTTPPAPPAPPGASRRTRPSASAEA
jgi:hypothetical protein